MDVIYEDNHLLVVNKPPGLATVGVRPEDMSLAKAAKAYLKQRYRKPGNVFLGVVSRLDAPVSGVVVLARTSKAAARLSEQFRERDVAKLYWALVAGRVEPASGPCVHWLRKDEARQRMCVVPAGTPGALEARLKYRYLRAVPRGCLLEVELLTGRKHQIRVQLAAQGWPIIGDRKYGSREPFPVGIALHSRSLTLRHPTREEDLTFVAPPPEGWGGGKS